MRYAALLILLSVCCLSACKKTAAQPAPVANTDQVDNDTLAAITKKINRADRIVDDFRTILLEEAAKFPVDFEMNKPKEAGQNNFLLSDPSLASFETVVFTDKNMPERKFSTTVYTFKGTERAMEIISNLCNDSRNEMLRGEPPVKIASRAFRLDSLIFEVDNFSGEIEHIIHTSFNRLKEKYSIYKDDVIPCEREFISAALAKKIKPAVSKWLKFYDADINYFYNIGYGDEDIECQFFDQPFEPEDTLSIYYRPYDKKHDDIYEPILYDYSPDRNYYLNVRETSGVFKHEDGKWYYMGGDDCQEIYLTNRKSKQKGLVLWLGAGDFAEAAFWVDNRTYIITGIEFSYPRRLFMKIGGKHFVSEKPEIPEEGYFIQDIRSRGIITDE